VVLFYTIFYYFYPQFNVNEVFVSSVTAASYQRDTIYLSLLDYTAILRKLVAQITYTSITGRARERMAFFFPHLPSLLSSILLPISQPSLSPFLHAHLTSLPFPFTC